MKRTYSIQTRLLAMLVSIAMLAVYLPTRIIPVSAEPVGTYSATVDPHTLDQWRDYFGTQTNHAQDVELTTEFAGGVWTDKSVFLPGNLPSQLTDAAYNGTGIAAENKGDNFLVALSAMASNKQIKGYSTVPTDTVLVLDLSSSMRYTDDNDRSAVDELIAATNKAITDLLALNRNNRVAVVVYAGNTNKSFSDANGITQVIMPLDSYTTDQAGVYLQADPLQVEQSGGWYGPATMVPNTNPYGLAVYDGVTGTINQNFRENSFEVSTGTYMQDGIYEAMRLLLAAEPVVQDGVQAGTARMPIMVIMSDGEPTMATPDYNGNDSRTDLGTSSLYNYSGNTALDNSTTYSNRDLIAFMSSLTAAFAKNQMEEHYNNKALIYTLAYGDTVLERQEARSVLDPVNASDIQNDLWDRFLAGEQVRVGSYTTGSGRNQQTHYYTTRNSAVAGERLDASDRYYVEKYFAASNDDAMSQAFGEIVNQIIIQSKYYPTYVEGSHDHDGYLTFVDKIGEYMQVSDIKGIVIGNRLFSGAALASALGDAEDKLGTVENPTTAGDELIHSVKERLGVASTAEAQALVADAYDKGQLAYTSDSEFSHYIGWQADADGNYLDFWYEGMAESQYHADAAYIMKSYGFLGDTTVVPGVSNTDMMYMTVRIATQIATGESIITWKIPASLIPTITYLVDVEVDEDGQIQRLISLETEANTADSPIRLVYEVELREDIKDWNITQKVPNPKYTTHKAAGYVFYTNKWSASGAEDVTRNTYSHFEPSVENERYYYTQDTQVLVKNGENYTPYTGAKPTGSGYYHAYQVFEKLENGNLRIHEHYEPISSEAMAYVEADGNNWVIPKGVIHRYYDYEITAKEENPTGTMAHSDHPFVIRENDAYYTYSTQGNNGKLVVTPATGIKLTKTLAQGYDTTESFTFVLSGGSIVGAELVRLDDIGNEASRAPLSVNGEFTLAAGETVYIVGLAAGAYTVAEQIPANAEYQIKDVKVDGISVGSTQANVTLTAQNITDVEFTNDAKRYGSLVVSKDVTYPDGFAPGSAHDNKQFTVEVTFAGDLENMPTPDGAIKNGNTYTVTLKDMESVTFTGIPQGVSYTVTETGLTDGYTNTGIEYSDDGKTIAAGDADQVHVINAYAPAPVSADLQIKGAKTVVGTWPAGVAFTVRLWQVFDFGSGDVVKTERTAVVNEAKPNYTIDISDIPFDKVGTYYIRVAEDIPDATDRIPDMAYDRTLGMFSIQVTDEDADSKLEIKDNAVLGHQGTPVAGNAQDGWTVTKDFTNVVTKDIVYLNVQKNVEGAGGENHRADIPFGLFNSMNEAAPAYYALTDGQGKATIAVPVSQDSLGTEGKIYYMREIAPDVKNGVVGMNYDESWIYAIRITWDAVNHKAVVEYAPITNNTVGAYAPYDAAVNLEHTNSYQNNIVTAPLVLSGQKLLNGETDLGGRTFQFSLYDADASFHLGALRQTVSNVGNTIAFDGITYDTPGLKQLIVKENPTNYGGVTIDTTEYHITLLVEKYVDTDGITKLKIDEDHIHITKYGTAQTVQTNELDFNNTYAVSGKTSVTIEGSKVLRGRPMLSGEFHFLLEQVKNAAGEAMQDGIVRNAENGSAVNNVASFTFEPVEFTAVGEYYFKLTEVAGPQNSRIDYSDAQYIIQVTVSDNNEGGLRSDWRVVDTGGQPLADQTIQFVNVYTPVDLQVMLRGVKTLQGKDLEGNDFRFTIKKTESDFATVIRELETVSNNIDGEIVFSPLTFSAGNTGYELGTHYFVITEQIPATPAGGITYDTTEYLVTVTVENDGSGVLKETVQIVAKDVVMEEGVAYTLLVPADSIAFDNLYAYSGTADRKSVV